MRSGGIHATLGRMTMAGITRLIALGTLLGVQLALAGGCQRGLYDPQQATRAYPSELHGTASIDVQVFRDGSDLTLYNATPHTFRDFDLWVNQRYVHRVDELAAGGQATVNLWNFYDVFGEVINAGGIWRVDEPTPVRHVELQPAPGEPLTGLITIRAESAE